MSEPRLRARRTRDDAILCDHLVLGGSFWRRFMGLMGRASMPQGEGLWLPTSSIHMFFMRFPIDALFLGAETADGARPVVGVRHGLPPWRGIVLPVRGAAGVIEMPAGTLARHGVAAGDTVVFEAAAEAGDQSGVSAA